MHGIKSNCMCLKTSSNWKYNAIVKISTVSPSMKQARLSGKCLRIVRFSIRTTLHITER